MIQELGHELSKQELALCEHCHLTMLDCSCLFCEICDAPCADNEESTKYVDMPGTFTGQMTVCQRCRTPEEWE